MTSRAADLIRDIDSANLAARRSEIRKLPLSDRRAAGDAADRAHRAAVNAFAALNGWQATKRGFNCLDLLGRSAMSDSLRARGARDCELLDHHIWFRLGRRYVAAVGQPYLSDVDIAETRAGLARVTLSYTSRRILSPLFIIPAGRCSSSSRGPASRCASYQSRMVA
jgi:hypothetical protein